MTISISSGAPKFIGLEADESQIITPTPGDITAVVGESRRGPSNQRVLVTNTRDFVSYFGKPDPSVSYMHYCALLSLEKGNSLYVTRVTGTGAAYSALNINEDKGGAVDTSELDAPLTNPAGITFSPATGTVIESIGTGDGTAKSFTGTLGQLPVTASTVTISVNGVTMGTDDGAGALTGTGLDSGSNINYTTGAITVVLKVAPANNITVDIEYDISNILSLFTVYAENQGAWGDNLKVSVENTNTTDNTFELVVFETIENVDIEVGRYKVSRESKVDGLGRQLYIEDRVNRESTHIRVKNNMAVNATKIPAESIDKVNLANGSNGSAPSNGDLATGWDLYTNKDDLELRILMNAGYVGHDDIVIQSKMKAINEARLDCVSILDLPFSDLSMGIGTPMIAWRTETQNFNSSYTGLYGPWVRVYDTYNDIVVNIPPSGFVAGVFSKTNQTVGTGEAPAGTDRGELSSGLFPVLGLSHTYTDGQRDLMYRNQINPLRDVKGVGRLVFGQKTQYVEDSARTRFNVRLLIIELREAILKQLFHTLFKNNTPFLRRKVKSFIDRYMEEQKVYSSATVVNTSNNTNARIGRNEFHVDLYVDPERTAEFGIFRTIITPVGTSFRELFRR